MIKDQASKASRFLLALMIVAVMITAFLIVEIRFGGPIQKKHALQDEMLADILPPPAYVVEPYLASTLAAGDPAKARDLLKDMDALHAEFTARQAYWDKIKMPRELHSQLDRVLSVAAQFWQAVDTHFAPAVRKGDANAIRVAQEQYLTPIYKRQHMEVMTLVKLSRDYVAKEKARDAMLVNLGLVLASIIGALIIGTVIMTSRMLSQRVLDPLQSYTRTIGHLASGDLDCQIEGISRRDEFGTMARSMDVFRQSGIARRAAEEEQRRVVEALSLTLDKLASKDLEYRIPEDDFPASYDVLRKSFNQTLDTLAGVMGTVRVGTASVMTSIGEIRAGSDDLAMRNQQQAANLEETAAAMRQVTARVREAANSAADAQGSIEQARKRATEGGDVVRAAIAAMAAIEASAQEISSIINVIDGIAFQTNLLALNAGVEAARAGEAGKGFAVVATEVRALAQRSADAAQDIKSLISKSTTEVGHGVELVGQTGGKLDEIMAEVGALHTLMTAMARSAKEQAENLNQVNVSVGEMDTMTQQNAAMVEETTAATRSLEGEAISLSKLVSTFRTRSHKSRPDIATDTDRLRRTTSATPPPSISAAA